MSGRQTEIYESPEYWCGNTGYRAPGYSDFPINSIKEILIMLFKPKSVLEIGCAYGFTVRRLNQLGIPAQGIDCSQYAIKKVPDIYATGALRQALAWELPFKDGEFDFGYSSGVFEHIPGELLGKSISEMVRICKRGLVGVSCLDDKTTHREDDTTHETILTLAQWRNLFPEEYLVISDSEESWRIHAEMNVRRLMEGVCLA